jgi:hypothetical protein
MSEVFWATYAVLWLFVVVLVILVLLLYRQFGLMLMPGVRRANLAGLDIDAVAPPISLEFRDNGRAPILSWSAPELGEGHVAWVALFGNANCSVCKRLWQKDDLAELARSWPSAEWLWIDSRWRPTESPFGWTVAVSEAGFAADVMDVPVFPYVYVIKPGGAVLAKGLVNSAHDLNLVAREGLRRAKGMKETAPVGGDARA